MKRFWTLIITVIIMSFNSCAVKEQLVFNEDGSGTFLVTYDMSQIMSQMGDAFQDIGPEDDKEDDEDSTEIKEKKPNTVIDSIIYFKDIFEQYKDSIAQMTDRERYEMETLKDMYMTMKMNEELKMFNYGIGLEFKKVEDLKDIQERVEKAKSFNEQGEQLDMMKEGSPMGKYMGDGDQKVDYYFTETSFSRVTTMPEKAVDDTLDLNDNPEEGDDSFSEELEGSFYSVEITFPKRIKSTSVKDALISEDGKTVSYKVNWADYLKDPKLLDISVEFENE
ncbi:MAG: hypothetical protein KJP20_02860 [Bacteroidia bacterium]|nr:hypothetical protein [Bacteroidia bacterium]NNK60397.1 hypothetical protein [Flavobacteriaceae bacterium]